MSKTIDDILLNLLPDKVVRVIDDGASIVEDHSKVRAKARAQLEALLLREDAPRDIEFSEDGECDICGGLLSSCNCRTARNETNTAWRQHIRNKLGSKGQDNE